MTTVCRLRYLQCREGQPRSGRPGVGQLVLSRTARGRNRCHQQGASQGSVRKQRCVGAQTIPACRQQHISAEESLPVVAKSTSPNWPGCVAIRSAIPRMSGRGAGKPRDREKRTATWSVPASSSQATPVLPTAPRRPIIPSRTSPRGCSAFLPRALPSRKNAPPRALPTNVASISPRHLSGFVTSQLLRGAGLAGRRARVEASRECRASLAASRRPHIPPEALTSDPTARDGLILPDPRSLGLRHR
jgi:hypothetical protein